MDTLSSMTLILAIATFILAGIAAYSIWQNYRLQKRERRERLLNEIIEWAINVVNCNIGVNSLNILKSEEAPTGKTDQILTNAQLTEWSLRLQSLLTRGKYISATAKIFCDDLKNVIKTLNDDLDKFIKSLGNCADIKYKGLPR